MTGNSEMLDALRFELKFLEDGGYGRSPRTPWRASLIFEDSPSCLNFDDNTRPHPCAECLLMKFVPEAARDQERPCRLIPLDPEGRTIEHLYHYGTQAQLEESLGTWLKTKIGQLEAEAVR
jgi:hypothetical protein